MAIFDFLKKIFAPKEIHSAPNASAKKLSYAEKELIAVKRTTFQDIQQLSNLPFVWNSRLEKCIQPNSHPFAYMDIVGPNVAIAMSELEKMNVHISQAKLLCKKVPKSLQIPVDDIVFKRSSITGYSRLICSPISHLGEPTDAPITFSFMTDLDRRDTTHGNLYYGRDGGIQKADVYFWRKSNGYFFYYQTVANSLTLSKIESVTPTGEKNVIYKGQHILELEASRVQEETDFAWIQQNLPDKCPKNIAGFRRMKNQNTKNYQLLQQLAAEKGREI
ncbi:MAG: hypothetical protein E7470_08830 [Ruminococcaceae bacterium]|nr:hypothetical protein [Oscillospiraceae bacterium]